MKIGKKELALLSILLLLLIAVGLHFLIQRVKYVQESPYDVLVSDISSNSVVISWKTDIPKPTLIKVGDSIYGDERAVTDHRLKVSGLKEFSEYDFEITDRKREWGSSQKESSGDISTFVIDNNFVFKTSKEFDEIAVPLEEEVLSQAYDLSYLALFDSESNTFSSVKTVYTNRFGGGVIDKRSMFDSDMELFIESYPNAQLREIEYGKSNVLVQKSLNIIPIVSASSINCDQTRSALTTNAISKEAYSDLATRWVAGRGKHYATECYNDVIYRSKSQGVDPAFALTIWLNESGASNYTQSADKIGYIEDFGIHGLASVPTQNFDLQINHFLKRNHSNTCPGLTAWEAWGNIYLWGNCNENDAVKRQQGIDYYKGINNVYRLVTNGDDLPNQVTELPTDIVDEDDQPVWETYDGPLCCALKLDNKENLRGDFENNVKGKSCEDIWSIGRSVHGGKIESVAYIPNKVGTQCEVEYSGVCCSTEESIQWYPEYLCKEKIPNISNSSECKELANTKACFLREGKYKWLAKGLDEDFLAEVTSESSCNARNSISNYRFTFNKGVNLVGFDFSPVFKTQEMLASQLLSLNGNILLVAKFEDNVWSNIVVKSEILPFSGDDFVLEQGKGYLIISSDAMVVEIDAWRDPDIKLETLTGGWNLVGGSLYTKNYYASNLLDFLSRNKKDVLTVAKWEVETGHFIYRTEDEEEYGDDFKLTSLEGLFLKSVID